MSERIDTFLKKIKNIDFILYLIKCACGAGICYCFYLLFPQKQLYGSIVSVLLVLAPGMEDSIRLSITRIMANIIGAAVGLIFFLTLGTHACSLIASVMLTILICSALGIENATRSALAALVIVLINGKEKNDWHVGIYRVVSVIIGCLIAILLSYLFLYATKAIKKIRAKRAVAQNG